MRFRITHSGHDYEVSTCAADMVQWETHARENKLPIVPGSTDFPQVTYGSFLAYSAGKRAEFWNGNFHQWLEGYEDFVNLDAEKSDPTSTQPGASTG